MEWINNIGAVATMAMGCLGLFFPAKASTLTGLIAETAPARGEFRGTFGGAFLFLGLVPLFTQNSYAFLIVGLCWLGAALGRMASIFIDGAAKVGRTRQVPRQWRLRQAIRP